MVFIWLIEAVLLLLIIVQCELSVDGSQPFLQPPNEIFGKMMLLRYLLSSHEECRIMKCLFFMFLSLIGERQIGFRM